MTIRHEGEDHLQPTPISDSLWQVMESIEAHPDDRLEGDTPAARRIAIADLLERFQRSRLVVLGGDTNLRFRVGLHLSMTMSLRLGLPLDVFQPPVPHDQLTTMLLAWTADESTVRCLTRRVTELGVDRCTIAASTLAHHPIRFHREATPFARILEAMELPAPPIAPRPALVAELAEGALIRQERETPRRAGKRATQPTRMLWLNLAPFAPKQGDDEAASRWRVAIEALADAARRTRTIVLATAPGSLGSLFPEPVVDYKVGGAPIRAVRQFADLALAPSFRALEIESERLRLRAVADAAGFASIWDATLHRSGRMIGDFE